MNILIEAKAQKTITQFNDAKIQVGQMNNSTKVINTKWFCDACNGSSDTGCLWHDRTNCQR